jgi:hypothetical protein
MGFNMRTPCLIVFNCKPYQAWFSVIGFMMITYHSKGSVDSCVLIVGN